MNPICAFKPKNRFRALVRKVICNLIWMLESEKAETIGDDVAKNVLLLTRKKKMDIKPRGHSFKLNFRQKCVLKHRPDDRNEHDLDDIAQTLNSMKAFKNYSPSDFLEVVRHLYLECYKPNTIIYKEYRKSNHVYIGLSGVLARVQLTDEPNKMVINSYVYSGSMSGEIGVLLDAPRAATLAAITPSEVLIMQNQYFGVMRTEIQVAWQLMANAISRFSYFSSYDHNTKVDCCTIGQRRSYGVDEVILGDNFGSRNLVYFVLSGRCAVIEQITVRQKEERGKVRYSLMKQQRKYHTMPTGDSFMSAGSNMSNPSEGNMGMRSGKSSLGGRTIASGKSSQLRWSRLGFQNRASTSKSIDASSGTVKTYFIRIAELNKLACFGIGENLINRRIVAMTEVECLIIPYFWLMKRNRDQIWTRIAHYLDKYIPNTEAIFEHFLEQQKWRKYKKQLFESVCKISPCNSIHNVPYSIRIREDYDFINS